MWSQLLQKLCRNQKLYDKKYFFSLETKRVALSSNLLVDVLAASAVHHILHCFLVNSLCSKVVVWRSSNKQFLLHYTLNYLVVNSLTQSNRGLYSSHTLHVRHEGRILYSRNRRLLHDCGDSTLFSLFLYSKGIKSSWFLQPPCQTPT